MILFIFALMPMIVMITYAISFIAKAITAALLKVDKIDRAML